MREQERARQPGPVISCRTMCSQKKSEGAAAAAAVAARCICRLREQELKEDAKLVSQRRIWQKDPLNKKKKEIHWESSETHMRIVGLLLLFLLSQISSSSILIYN